VIVRAFHATATAAGADAYRDHVTRTVLPSLQAIDGYRAVVEPDAEAVLASYDPPSSTTTSSWTLPAPPPTARTR
jgi:hypothetical protein